jgi:MFS transporter, OFA family, oxalate/formate antiporter
MNRRGWVVTLAGLGLNLALGILYAWSVFGKQLVESVEKGGYGWSNKVASVPYMTAIACFALMMVPAGRLQDRVGPRLVATAGGVLTGLGLIIASFSSPESILPAVIGFGLFGGTGFGLGYASATPPVVKWFPPEKKGLMTGLVVAGFGIAPVYIAPTAKHLLHEYGIAMSFRILGVAFLVIATLFAQLIQNPSAEFMAEKAKKAAAKVAAGGAPANDRTWKDAVKTPTFWILYVQYACAATAGLMIIGQMAKIVTVQSAGAAAGIAPMMVALLAAFNAGGRVVAGVLSDRIGRTITLVLVCIAQALAMFFFARFTTPAAFMMGAAVVGFSYGSCLSLFPSTAADLWGTKNMGVNYGLLFTAWGVGGVAGPLLASSIVDKTGAYVAAYDVAGLLVTFAAVLGMLTYIQVSVKLPEREVTIRFGKKAKAA